MSDVPVVIIVFNRPDCAKRLIEALAVEKPTSVYVVSDGARASFEGEVERVSECRRLFDKLPWHCSIRRNYATENMGCMKRIVSGLNWVFDQEDRAIILEDDCIPNAGFFEFCREQLDKFSNERRVMSISGTRLAPTNPDDADYIFSQYSYCWGWATWARAWAEFDPSMSEYLEIRDTEYLRRKLGGIWRAIYWRYVLDRVVSGKINSWAYRWTFAHWIRGAFSVVPKNNLITNIGFGQEATNTIAEPGWLSRSDFRQKNTRRRDGEIQRDLAYDEWVENTVFSKSFVNRIRWLLSKIPMR